MRTVSSPRAGAVDSVADFTTAECNPDRLGFTSVKLFRTNGSTTSSIARICARAAALAAALEADDGNR